MTNEELKHQAAICQAASDGKVIQWRKKGSHEWQKCSIGSTGYFNVSKCEYRIAPEPMEIWVAKFTNGCLGHPHTAPERLFLEHGATMHHFREVL